MLAEFSLLAYYYMLQLHWKQKHRVIWASAIIYLGYSLFSFVVSPRGEFDFSLVVIESLFFLFLMLLFFYEKMKYNLKEPIYYSPQFWFSVASLVYFSGNFFLFLVTQSNIHNQQFIINYNMMYGFFTFLKNIILCVGIYTHIQHSDKCGKRLHSRIDTQINLDYVR